MRAPARITVALSLFSASCAAPAFEYRGAAVWLHEDSPSRVTKDELVADVQRLDACLGVTVDLYGLSIDIFTETLEWVRESLGPKWSEPPLNTWTIKGSWHPTGKVNVLLETTLEESALKHELIHHYTQSYDHGDLMRSCE